MDGVLLINIVHVGCYINEIAKTDGRLALFCNFKDYADQPGLSKSLGRIDIQAELNAVRHKHDKA